MVLLMVIVLMLLAVLASPARLQPGPGGGP